MVAPVLINRMGDRCILVDYITVRCGELDGGKPPHSLLSRTTEATRYCTVFYLTVCTYSKRWWISRIIMSEFPIITWASSRLLISNQY